MVQRGIVSVFVILGVLIVGIIGAVIMFGQRDPSVVLFPQGDKKEAQNIDEPPLKLKSIGVDLDYYDPQTGKAGDFVFTKQKFQFNRLFMGFGFVIPADMSSSREAKANPQPTFVVPLGTPVLSLVDGVVANMPVLWSGDVSIQVTSDGKLQRWIYETEHVINPKVKIGDKVKAGQIIAEVGNFDNGTPEGFGIVEIGILHGGGDGPPEHVCPFAYLNESIKAETLKRMSALFESWEEYFGDQTLYGGETIPGCITLEPIEG